MIGVELEERKEVQLPDDTCHYYCEYCFPQADVHCIAYCGTDVASEPEVMNPSDSQGCAMCNLVLAQNDGYCPQCNGEYGEFGEDFD